MSGPSGDLSTFSGWQLAETYFNNPTAESVPNASRQEVDFGMVAYQLTKTKEIFDTLTLVAGESGDNTAAIAAAQAAADAAQTAADNAQSSANAAQSSANAAQSSANAAQSSANAAQVTADAAVSSAAAAQAAADAAQTGATNAQAAADAAQATATAALGDAATAQADAVAAQDNASSALFGYTTVADIAARDLLTPALDDVVAVNDASADPAYTPDPVPAIYQWNGSAWVDVTDSYVTYLALQVGKNADLIATNAQNIATNATNIGNAAQAAADAAQGAADAAQGAADAAQATADTANSAAATAQSTADTATSAAATAQSTADTATSAAATAQSTADAINALVGAINGIATLDGSGKVPSSQLPSYVDDVIEVANFAALPGTGETGKIYVTLDDNFQYRWTGSVYVNILQDSNYPLLDGSRNFTGAVKFAAGAEATPSLTFGVDTNTGFYRPTTDQISASCAGTRRLNLNGAYLGIYTTTGVAGPDGSATAPAYAFNSDLNTGMYSGGADILAFATGTVKRMDISNSGLALATGARVDTIETTLTNDDTHLPTSGAVSGAIAERLPRNVASGYDFMNLGTGTQDLIYSGFDPVEGDVFRLTVHGGVTAHSTAASSDVEIVPLVDGSSSGFSIDVNSLLQGGPDSRTYYYTIEAIFTYREQANGRVDVTLSITAGYGLSTESQTSTDGFYYTTRNYSSGSVGLNFNVVSGFGTIFGSSYVFEKIA